MKAIIAGVSVDTDTATEIGQICANLGSDFDWLVAMLYRAPGGQHFMVGMGGVFSPFGATAQKSVQSDFATGWALVCHEDALKWVAASLPAATLMEHFGPWASTTV